MEAAIIMARNTKAPGLNKALKAFRVFHRMTQKNIAEKLELPASFVSEMETGKKTVTLSLVEKYASLFKVPSWEIVYLGEAYDRNRTRKGISGKRLDLLDWVTSDDTTDAVKLELKENSQLDPVVVSGSNVDEGYSEKEFGIVEKKQKNKVRTRKTSKTREENDLADI